MYGRLEHNGIKTILTLAALFFDEGPWYYKAVETGRWEER